jgi:L-asparaginase
MPKSISIVYTGGTVGMETTDQGLRPATFQNFSSSFRLLLDLKDSGLPDFDLQASTPILDSARMKPRDWIRLATEVATNYSRYDGFLLIMGTDTMSYTASALSFFLENIRKPVIITGSQLPLSHLSSDAPANLIGSMRALEQADDFSEVAIFFNGNLIRGNRSVKVSSTEVNGIVSPRFPVLSQLDKGILSPRKFKLPDSNGPFRLISTTDELPRVSFLRIYPGLDPDLLSYALKEPVRGLILETYGSGTAPDDPEFLAPLEHATNRGVVIVSTTQCVHGGVDMDRYKVGRALRDVGVIGGGEMTTAAAHTKLVYLLACGVPVSEVRERVSTDLRGELTPANDDRYLSVR